MLSVFDQLLHAETFTDVTLAVDGQYLKAHKVSVDGRQSDRDSDDDGMGFPRATSLVGVDFPQGSPERSGGESVSQ